MKLSRISKNTIKVKLEKVQVSSWPRHHVRIKLFHLQQTIMGVLIKLLLSHRGKHLRLDTDSLQFNRVRIKKLNPNRTSLTFIISFSSL